MIKSIKFELVRLCRSKSLILILLVILMIGILGFVLTYALDDGKVDAKQTMLGLYNAFTQFSFIMLGFFFVYLFARDYQKGVYAYLDQIGLRTNTVILSKLLLYAVISIIPISLFFVATHIATGNDDAQLLYFLLSSVLLATLFILALSALIASLAKKVLVSTLSLFALFLGFNAINLFAFGVTNQADSNSISTFIAGKLAGVQSAGSRFAELNIDLDIWGIPISIALSLIWLSVVLIALFAVSRVNSRKV